MLTAILAIIISYIGLDISGWFYVLPVLFDLSIINLIQIGSNNANSTH